MCSTTLRRGASAGKRSRMDSPDGSRICSAETREVQKRLQFVSASTNLHGLTMRTQLLSTLVRVCPPSFCPSPLGADVSAAALVCFFCCKLLRSSAIRFSTDSRSCQAEKHTHTHTRARRDVGSEIHTLLRVITVRLSSSAQLTCFFCRLSARASCATRCLCCSSKSLLSGLMRDSTGSGSGDRFPDWDGLSNNEGEAV